MALDRRELDITDQAAVTAAIEAIRPRVVINTAAFHVVDKCESDPFTSYAVNSAAPLHLATLCERRGACLVHFSTDYVFSGAAARPYVETDSVGPVNVYGLSKAAGEEAVRSATERHLIVRTTGIYGHGGRDTGRGNFVETMLRVGSSLREVAVVDDQRLTPTFAPDLAAAALELLDASATGTYHATASGDCTWYEFAREIFRVARLPADLRPTSQEERPLPARRPEYSVLSKEKLASQGFNRLRDWQGGLAAYLAG